MAKLQIPLLKTGNKFIDKAFAIACGDLAGNIGPYRSGLLKTEAPVIRAGLQYSAPWTRDASFNTWYAGCAPCRSEAPGLVALATERAADGVRVLGINTQDDAGAAQAFERTFEVPYPSVADSSGQVVARLSGVVPLQAVPTTVVLDRDHRPAARIIGEADPSTLDAIIDEILAEPTEG